MKYPLGFNTWGNNEINEIKKVLKAVTLLWVKKLKLLKKKICKTF